MKKFFASVAAVIALLAALLGLAACDTEKELGSLEDLSKPYAGIYLCEKLTLSGEDKLPAFEHIRLELGRGGGFTIRYKTQKGNEGSVAGTYEMDAQKNEVTFRAKQGMRTLSRTYPVEGGCIIVEENILGRLLFAKFKPE